MDNKPDPRVTKIRTLWADSNYTQHDLACSLNMSQSCISQYLNNNIPMNTDTVLKFADFFNVTPATIDSTLKF